MNENFEKAFYTGAYLALILVGFVSIPLIAGIVHTAASFPDEMFYRVVSAIPGMLVGVTAVVFSALELKEMWRDQV